MTYGELKKKAESLRIDDNATIGIAITDKSDNTTYSYNVTGIDSTITLMLVDVKIDFDLTG